ncbi:MAG: hypothetical protein EXQ57_06545 [Bryobacterales bacterium]|nr:hypothetical protein [Bryobacterales bacterium]
MPAPHPPDLSRIGPNSQTRHGRPLCPHLPGENRRWSRSASGKYNAGCHLKGWAAHWRRVRTRALYHRRRARLPPRRGPYEFTAALEALGAAVSTIAFYHWELPDDSGPLKEAARRLSRGAVDVLVFTTSAQYPHLMEIVSNLGLSGQVYQAMQSHTVVASNPTTPKWRPLSEPPPSSRQPRP